MRSWRTGARAFDKRDWRGVRQKRQESYNWRNVRLVAEERNRFCSLENSEDVFLPLIPYVSADILVALEAIEALRYVEYLKKDGVILMNRRIMHPPIETSKIITVKGTKYITPENIVSQLRSWTPNIAVIDALGLARESGNVNTENTVFLSCLSALEVFPVEENYIRESIAEAVPKKTVEQNLKAFDLGRKNTHDSLCTACSMQVHALNLPTLVRIRAT
jgi:indolepyruvate ferredoxin oxidoreductase beta subunit